jgi:hypothetical protein
MIFPKGEVAYENLRTAFVDLNSFLQTLKEDNFTGYLQMSFWDYEGILFLEAGEIVNAIVETQGKRSGGEEAMENIILMSKQKDGRINVYRLIPEMVTILASTTMKEATYKDLSTEFTSLDKLLDKLSKEDHSGFIDITLNDKKGWGIILFQEGEIIEAVMADEKSVGVSGKNSLEKIVEEVEKRGATFNVYRAALEGRVDRAIMTQNQDLQGVVIEVMQEVVRTIEFVVDSSAKRTGTFLENLKKAQIEKSDDYPFLDPFAAEFEYKDGEIQLQGKVPVEKFIRGIKDCIYLTLDKTPLDITKQELYARIKTSLQPTIEKFKKEIDGIGLKSTMPEFIVF